VIPTFNRANIIAQTIGDVRRQTYPNLEIIVVDDGSTDDTRARLEEFGNEIRVVAQQNQGAASARNRGISEARGEIIAFQDSDDQWHPTKIARQVGLLQKLGPAVPCCVCNAVFRSESPGGAERQTFSIGMLRPTHEEGLWLNPAEVIASRCIFFNQVVAVRRDALMTVGGYNSQLRYLEEWDLALKLARLGPWGFIREPLTYWNPGSQGSITSRAKSEAVQLHGCGVRLLTDALATGENQANIKTRSYLVQTLRSQRRMQYAWQVNEKKFVGASVIGRTLMAIERYFAAVMRRTGHFPKMITKELDHRVDCGELYETYGT